MYDDATDVQHHLEEKSRRMDRLRLSSSRDASSMGSPSLVQARLGLDRASSVADAETRTVEPSVRQRPLSEGAELTSPVLESIEEAEPLITREANTSEASQVKPQSATKKTPSCRSFRLTKLHQQHAVPEEASVTKAALQPLQEDSVV